MWNAAGTGALDATGRGFTGHRENRGLGLTYMNARFYVPGVGRFATADTIVPDPVNPQSWNRYSYVQNNPINRIDPSGNFDLGSEADGYNENSELYKHYSKQGWDEEVIHELFRLWENKYKDWWNLLLEAKIGDVIDHGVYYSRFTYGGRGNVLFQQAYDRDFKFEVDDYDYRQLDELFFGWDRDEYYDGDGLDLSLHDRDHSASVDNILLVRRGASGALNNAYGYVAGTGVFADSNSPKPAKLGAGDVASQVVAWGSATYILRLLDGPLPAFDYVIGTWGAFSVTGSFIDNRLQRGQISQYAHPY